MFSNVSFHNDPGQLLCGCGNVVACAFTPVDRLLCSETGITIITILLFFLGAVRFYLAKFLKFPKFSITCTYTVLSLVKVPWFIFHDSAHSGHLSGWIVNIFKMHLLRNEKACFDFEWRRHLTVALLQVNSWLMLRGISKTTQLLPFTELTYVTVHGDPGTRRRGFWQTRYLMRDKRRRDRNTGKDIYDLDTWH